MLASNYAKKAPALAPAGGGEPRLPVTGLGRGARLGLGPGLGRQAFGSLSLKALGDRIDLGGKRPEPDELLGQAHVFGSRRFELGQKGCEAVACSLCPLGDLSVPSEGTRPARSSSA